MEESKDARRPSNLKDLELVAKATSDADNDAVGDLQNTTRDTQKACHS